MPLLFAFDLDDVLYAYDWRLRMSRLSTAIGMDVAEMRRRWWHMDGEGAAETGKWPTPESYLAAATEALGVTISPAEWLGIRGSAMTPLPESIAAASRAAELGHMTLLTNNGALIGAALPELAPDIVPLFGVENLRATAYYGARKPDPVVFERLLLAYDAPPRHTFFADDRLENVEAAASVGITAHHFRNADGLLSAIEAFAAAH